MAPSGASGCARAARRCTSSPGPRRGAPGCARRADESRGRDGLRHRACTRHLRPSGPSWRPGAGRWSGTTGRSSRSRSTSAARPKAALRIAKFGVAGRGVDRFVAVTEALAREAHARGAGEPRAVVAATPSGSAARMERPGDASARRSASPSRALWSYTWAGTGGGREGSARRGRAPARRARPRGACVLSLGAPAAEVEPPVKSLPFTEQWRRSIRLPTSSCPRAAPRASGTAWWRGSRAGAWRSAPWWRDSGRYSRDWRAVARCRSRIPMRSRTPSLAPRRAGALAELGESNRAHIVRNYELRDWARRMADLYDELGVPR